MAEPRELILKLGQKITDRIGVKVTENDPEYWGLASVVTDEMAEVALAMKVRVPATAAEVAKKCKKSVERTEELLEEMSVIGVIEYNWENEDHHKQYVLPMFGIPNSDKWLYIDEDKKVQFAPVQQGFRDCVEWLSECYAEGLLDPECLSQDGNTLQTKLSEGNVGFFTAWRLKAMGWDDGVAANSECILPPSVDGKGAYMDRYLELARPCAFITATNEHVEESIRLLDAMMDTEMQADLYYGPQNPTEGTGWVYDEENGKINTVTVSDVTVKNQIDCNTQFFAPGDYISENYNLSEQRLEKIDYCQMYDEAGVINTYSSQYFAMSGLTADVLADFSLIETDIDNAVSEAVADFVAHGVTDDSWDSFVSKFDGMNIDQYVSTYQEAIDGMDLE